MPVFVCNAVLADKLWDPFPTQSRVKCLKLKIQTNLDQERFMLNHYIHLKEKALKFRLIPEHSHVSMKIFVQLALHSNPFYAKIISPQRLRTDSFNVILVTECNM